MTNVLEPVNLPPEMCTCWSKSKLSCMCSSIGYLLPGAVGEAGSQMFSTASLMRLLVFPTYWHVPTVQIPNVTILM